MSARRHQYSVLATLSCATPTSEKRCQHTKAELFATKPFQSFSRATLSISKREPLPRGSPQVCRNAKHTRTLNSSKSLQFTLLFRSWPFRSNTMQTTTTATHRDGCVSADTIDRTADNYRAVRSTQLDSDDEQASKQAAPPPTSVTRDPRGSKAQQYRHLAAVEKQSAAVAVRGWEWVLATLAHPVESDKRCTVRIADSVLLLSSSFSSSSSSSSNEPSTSKSSASSRKAGNSVLWLATHKHGTIAREKGSSQLVKRDHSLVQLQKLRAVVLACWSHTVPRARECVPVGRFPPQLVGARRRYHWQQPVRWTASEQGACVRVKGETLVFFWLMQQQLLEGHACHSCTLGSEKGSDL